MFGCIFRTGSRCISNCSASDVSTTPVARLGCGLPSFALSCRRLRIARCHSLWYARSFSLVRVLELFSLVLTPNTLELCAPPIKWKLFRTRSWRYAEDVLPDCLYWLLCKAVYTRSTPGTDTDLWENGHAHGRPPDPNPNHGVCSARMILR